MQSHEKQMSLKEALKHYLEATPREQWGAFRDFTQVHPDTLSRWKRKGADPAGIIRLFTLFFLAEKGYQLLELTKLQGPALTLAKMLAYRVLTVEQAREELGYADQKEIYIIVSGESPLRHPRVVRLEEILKRHAQALEEKLAARPHIQVRVPEVIAPVEEAAALTAPAKKAAIDSFVALARPLVPIAEMLLSDAFSAEDRKKLRGLMQGDGIFKLSTSLRDLCSETTRNSHRKK